jgi:nitroreductase
MAEETQLSWILTRRSIRRYRSEPVPEGIIRQVIEAAMYAPSAVNRQPWHFIVTSNRQLLERIPEIHPHASFVKNASHAILVCGDEELQHDTGYYLLDCGAATQNMLLAAHMKGLGACWIGIHPRPQRIESFSRLFGLPDHVKPFSLVSLGYPAEEKQQPDRYIKERIHQDLWGNTWQEA